MSIFSGATYALDGILDVMVCGARASRSEHARPRTLAATASLAQHEKLLSNNSEIEHLKLVIAKLRRMLFGAKSEQVEREIEQLELKLEEMEAIRAERAIAQRTSLNDDAGKPSRRPLPEHLPREVHTHIPSSDACPECGGELRKFGEDVSEMLEYVPSSFKVLRHVRPKLSCRSCDKIVQAEAPSRPIDRGIPGPGLLAHVLVAKYADHLPLYRQCEIYAREGVDLDRSTLADWVGAASCFSRPLIDELSRHVMAATKLHADDTPVPVLAPGNGKTKTGGSGRMSAMIAQLRSHPPRCGSPTRRTAKASIRAASERLHRDLAGRWLCRLPSSLRSRPHPRGRLLGACAPQVLRHRDRPPLPHRQRGHRAHRRSLCGRERHPRQASRCAARYASHNRNPCSMNCSWFEKIARCSPASRRRRSPSAMHSRAGPRLRATSTTAASRSTTMPPNAACAPSALGRKNFLFAGSDDGGERAAAIYTLTGTAKLNRLDPELYLRMSSNGSPTIP